MRKTLSFILIATLCASLVARAEAGSEKTTVFGPLALHDLVPTPLCSGRGECP
jgi:hypothetical protein